MEIIIKDLQKDYGTKKALKGIHLQIEKGMFGLLGPNGAGKTTLMRILATLLPPTAGEVSVGGVSIRERELIRAKTGYLPQEFAFYPHLTVYEVMDYLAILAGIHDRQQRRVQIVERLQQVNLWDQRKTKARALSGGMKRRLGIAQALLNDPEVIIVDEPTAGLDPEERVRFRNLLSDFAVKRTVILSTHIVGDIEFACEKVAILDRGTILYQGKVKELIDRADGFVWTVQADREEVNMIRHQFKVISYVPSDDLVTFRLLAKDRPTATAEGVRPTIEDAYMGLMGGIFS